MLGARIERQRKFSGADLLQTLVFGWLSHPDASLETLASMTATRQVQVTDTAIYKHFTRPCAHFLHAVLEEMTSVVVEASQEVPLKLLCRFEAVMLEDSSSIALPNELAEQWKGCGCAPGDGQAAVILHVRWELKQGHLHGLRLTEDASVIDQVRSKRLPCLQEASTLPTWDTWIGERLPLTERQAVIR